MAIKSLNNKMLNVAYLEGAESIVISGDGGGGDAEEDFGFPEKRVNFYDYDGTLLHTYTWEEALQMTELPPLPTHHEGLTCQEWNYTLEDIKAQDGWVNVGATYIPSDGKTKLHISILNEAELDMGINIYQSYKNGVIIDWGDGSEPETVDKTGDVSIPHTYSKIGKYVISLEVVQGNLYLAHSGTPSKSLFNYPYGMSASTNLLEELFIGDGITTLYTDGLAYCTSLKNITLPKSFANANVYSGAFNNIGIPNCMIFPRGAERCPVSGRIISLPATMTQLYKATGCTDFVTIPNGIRSLSSECFKSTDITSIHLPDTITSFGNSCFSSCRQLRQIDIPPKLTTISSRCFEDCRCLFSVKLPSGLQSIEAYAFQNSHLTNIQLPDTLKTIGISAFQFAFLTKINFPDGLNSIGQYAFSGNKLIEITIPKTVNTVGARAFASNSTLKSANILSESVSKNIPDGMFAGCYSLVDFSTACEIESIGAFAFQDVYMNGVELPPNAETYHFRYASLYDIHIPLGVKRLCLSNNHFRNIEIPESVETLDEYCFDECVELVDIDIPDSVTYIGSHCFDYCIALRKIRLPNNITTIPDYCFVDCRKLSEIHIPANVATIGTNALRCGDVLEILDFSNHLFIPTLSSSYSIKVNTNTEIRVPMALVDEWKAATNWSALADYIVGVE